MFRNVGGGWWRFKTCWPHMQGWNILFERCRTCELLCYSLIGLNCGDYYFDPSFTSRYTTCRLKSIFFLFMEFSFWISAVNVFRTAWTMKYPFRVFFYCVVYSVTIRGFSDSVKADIHWLVRTEDPFILNAIFLFNVKLTLSLNKIF
jgi:hypothetical protein